MLSHWEGSGPLLHQKEAVRGEQTSQDNGTELEWRSGSLCPAGESQHVWSRWKSKCSLHCFIMKVLLRVKTCLQITSRQLGKQDLNEPRCSWTRMCAACSRYFNHSGQSFALLVHKMLKMVMKAHYDFKVTSSNCDQQSKIQKYPTQNDANQGCS